jgi:hypothetical protein
MATSTTTAATALTPATAAADKEEGTVTETMEEGASTTIVATRTGTTDLVWKTPWRETQTGPMDRRQQGQDGRQPGQPATDKIPTIKIWYTNERSIYGKLNELNATTVADDPDIILLTETWCNSEISNSELAIDGYTLEAELRRDRTDTHNSLDKT